MATIVPYRQQTSSVVGAPDTRRGTLRVDGSNPLAGVAQGIGNYAEKIRVQTTRQELGDVRKQTAMAEAELSQALLDAGKLPLDDPDFVEKQQEITRGILDRYRSSNNHTTPEAIAAADENYSLLGSRNLIDIGKLHAGRTGQKAVLDFTETQSIENNIVYNQFDVLDQKLADVDALGDDPNNVLGGLEAGPREKLLHVTKQDLVDSALLGLIERNPWAAAKVLASGKYDTLMDADRRNLLSSKADSEGKVKTAEASAVWLSDVAIKAKTTGEVSDADKERLTNLVRMGVVTSGARTSILTSAATKRRSVLRGFEAATVEAAEYGHVREAFATGTGDVSGKPYARTLSDGSEITINPKKYLDSVINLAIKDQTDLGHPPTDAVNKAVGRLVAVGVGVKMDSLSVPMDAGVMAGNSLSAITDRKEGEDYTVFQKRALVGYQHWVGLEGFPEMRRANASSGAADYYAIVDLLVEEGLGQEEAIAQASVISRSGGLMKISDKVAQEVFASSSLADFGNSGDLYAAVTEKASLRTNLTQEQAMKTAIASMESTLSVVDNFAFNGSQLGLPPRPVWKYMQDAGVKAFMSYKGNAEQMEQSGLTTRDLRLIPLPGDAATWRLIVSKPGSQYDGFQPPGRYQYLPSLRQLEDVTIEYMGVKTFAEVTTRAQEEEAARQRLNDSEQGANIAQPLLNPGVGKIGGVNAPAPQPEAE